MAFWRLTLLGALASLQSEKPAKGRSEARSHGKARYAICLAAAGIAACAGMVSPDSSDEQKQKVVAERAQARWDSLIKGDLGGAYEYLSSGSKAAMPLDLYKAKTKAGLWRQAKVGMVDCKAEVCKVTMLITYDAKRIKGVETPMDETWIIEKGSAWYVYR